ncbi:MAG: flagellar type III secretion system pore protein FliP [Pseudomonadota bacterium]
MKARAVAAHVLCWALVLAVLLAPVLAQAQVAPEAGPDAVGADVLGDGAVALVDATQDLPTSSALRLVLMLTALTFLPAVVLVMTPFTRFVIVFALLRQAMGLQQAPPNQVLIGLSLFLSLLVMQPTLTQVNTDAVQPFLAGETQPTEALAAGLVPMRAFMLNQTRGSDLEAVLQIGHLETPDTLEEIPTAAVVSGYVLSELKTAFIIAIKVYLPFLVLDMVIASLLLGMGMMMLPPVIISLPFKLLLFVLMDGWNLLIRSMTAGFGA